MLRTPAEPDKKNHAAGVGSEKAMTAEPSKDKEEKMRSTRYSAKILYGAAQP